MFTILIVVQVCLALGVIGLVLIQHGKGADMGAAFGSGASATVFGSSGSGSFLSRVTSILAALFFLNSLLLAMPFINSAGSGGGSIAERVQAIEVPAQEEAAVAEKVQVEEKSPVAASDLPELPTEGEQGPADLPQ